MLGRGVVSIASVWAGAGALAHAAVFGRASRGCLPGLGNEAHGVAPAVRVLEKKILSKVQGPRAGGL